MENHSEESVDKVNKDMTLADWSDRNLEIAELQRRHVVGQDLLIWKL